MNAARITARRTALLFRLGLLIVLTVAVLLVVVGASVLTRRLTDSLSQRATVQATGYANLIVSTMGEASVVPPLLARDQTIQIALETGDFTATSQLLISLQEEIRNVQIQVLDAEGRTVAATDRMALGSNRGDEPIFAAAQRDGGRVFVVQGLEDRAPRFLFGNALHRGNEFLGVIVVAVDLTSYEATWRDNDIYLAVADPQRRVLVSSLIGAKGRQMEDVVADADAAITGIVQWMVGPERQLTSIMGTPSLATETNLRFRGWRLTYFAPIAEVQARVTLYLSLPLLALALIAAVALWWGGRLAARRSQRLAREGAMLRALNARLQREMDERRRVERNLKVAEASLEQTSKLAALGEMSAAVSHELAQPLAAMRTYLAGAKLLLLRRRGEEALTSFQRLDDLIARMVSITRQLRSFAAKGDDADQTVDLRETVTGALSMMAPQFGQFEVKVTQTLPMQPVWVQGDPVRLEQVLVNLLRNAIDAMRGTENRRLDILLTAGSEASLSVRDSGTGIDETDKLFEPFYTTKKAGEGVGLGLAISQNIVGDLGGRLTARNAESGGAVFTVDLPLAELPAAAE